MKSSYIFDLLLEIRRADEEFPVYKPGGSFTNAIRKPTPRKYAFRKHAVTLILSQRLLLKMTISRGFHRSFPRPFYVNTWASKSILSLAVLTNNLKVEYGSVQPKLCTRKTELELEIKFAVDTLGNCGLFRFIRFDHFPGTTVKALLVDLETGDVHPPVTVRTCVSATVKDLKKLIHEVNTSAISLIRSGGVGGELWWNDGALLWP